MSEAARVFGRFRDVCLRTMQGLKYFRSLFESTAGKPVSDWQRK